MSLHAVVHFVPAPRPSAGRATCKSGLFAAILFAVIATIARASDSERRWDDEIVYVVIVQKFFNGDPANDVMARNYAEKRDRLQGGFWGGDLAGVTAKIDDLADLGVTALLLYPVIQNDQRPIGRFLATGYRPKDYFQVDENFGDLAALKQLVQQAHAKGLRVILDLPLGMPGYEHPYVTDREKRDWFGPRTRYGTRQWNADRPEVADYLIGVGKFWKEQSGCDGFRMDSAQLHSVDFWKRFNRELKGSAAGDEFVILAELPVHPKKIGEMLKDAGFDSAYDFSAGIARDVFGKDEPVGKLSFVLKEGARYYPAPRSMIAQIDNYEDPEFIITSGEPKQPRMRAAMTYLLTLDRVPFIYTGSELGISYRDVGAAFPPDRRDSPFLKYVRKLIAVRKLEPALRRGTWTEVLSRQPEYAYLRTLNEDQILIVLNASAEAQNVRFAVGTKTWEDCHLDDLINETEVKQPGDDAPLPLEPFGACVLKVH